MLQNATLLSHRCWNCHKTLTFGSLLTRCINPLRLLRETTSERPKVIHHSVLHFWLRNVLRTTTGVHLFDISTSINRPIRRLNFQKSSEHLFCTNILTSKCASRHNGVHFSTSQLPKVVPEWCVLYILTSTRASRHNGVQCVQLFISHLARWLRTRRFSEPIFRPSGATNHWKNTGSRDFPIPFLEPASSFWLFLFSDLLSSALLFSDSSHLCFSICPYCRKFGF